MFKLLEDNAAPRSNWCACAGFSHAPASLRGKPEDLDASSVKFLVYDNYVILLVWERESCLRPHVATTPDGDGHSLTLKSREEGVLGRFPMCSQDNACYAGLNFQLRFSIPMRQTRKIRDFGLVSLWPDV